MKDCKKCKFVDSCEMPESFGYMNKGCRAYEERKPMTNADRIRAMSDEELAEMLSRSGKYFCCDTTKCDPRSERCDYGDECYDCWLDWLRQEATDAQ